MIRKAKKLSGFMLICIFCLFFASTAQAGNPYPTSQSWYDENGVYHYVNSTCTNYAWQQAYDRLNHLELPMWGNGGDWLANARNAGYPTGSTPKADSIVVWESSTGWGHCAYVTSADGSSFTYNEGGTYNSRADSNGVYVGHPYPDGYTSAPSGFIYLRSIVSYNANGGSGAPASQTKYAGPILTVSSTIPTRNGYTFVCWNNSADGSGAHTVNPGGQWGGDFDITFYAIWRQDGVYLDVNGYLDNGTVDGGTLSSYGTFDVYIDNVRKADDVNDFYSANGYWPIGSKYKITDIRATTGHTYLGVDSGSLEGTLTANTSVRLKFSTTYSISFDTNGGSSSPTTQTKIFGEALTLSSVIPTRDGYDFLGWNTNQNATSPMYVAGSSYTKNEAAILYAIWSQKKYTISFDANGGVPVNNVTVVHGSSLGTLPETSRTGYLFKGWYTEKNGGRQFTSSESITHNQTLYAHWSEPSMIVLPSALTVIEDEAFENVDTNAFIIPSGVTTIGSKAFANNSNLYSVICYSRTVSPSTDAFVNCPNLTVFGYEETPIHYYAIAKNIPFKPIAISDWVLDSEVPIGATLTGAEKWTYDQLSTETIISETPNLDGWNLIESKWEQTKTGTWKYANYPGGFDTNHSLYSKYEKSALSNQETTTFKRTVSSSSNLTFIFWHWTWYWGSTENKYINDHYCWEDGLEYNNFKAYENSDIAYVSGTDYVDWPRGGSEDGSRWWFKFEVKQQTYTEYKKIFTYERNVTESRESETEVVSNDEIINVQHWVKYSFE